MDRKSDSGIKTQAKAALPHPDDEKDFIHAQS